MKQSVSEAAAAALDERYAEDSYRAVKYAERTFTKRAMEDFLVRRARKAGFGADFMKMLREYGNKDEALESFIAEVVDPWPKMRSK